MNSFLVIDNHANIQVGMVLMFLVTLLTSYASIIYEGRKSLKFVAIGNFFRFMFYLFLYLDGVLDQKIFPAFTNTVDVVSMTFYLYALYLSIYRNLKSFVYHKIFILMNVLNVIISFVFFYGFNNVVVRRSFATAFIGILLGFGLHSIGSRRRTNDFKSTSLMTRIIYIYIIFQVYKFITQLLLPLEFSNIFNASWSVSFNLLFTLIMLISFNFGLLLFNMDDLSNRLIRMANIDPLTKTFQRGFFFTYLEKYMKQMERDKNNFYFIMVDMDHFKSINDHYGHIVGDSVLASFGEVLLDSVREGDIVGRYGGEEFMILLKNTDEEGGRKVIKRMKEKLLALKYTQDEFQVTFSGGARQVEYQDLKGLTVEALIDEVDQKLYHAKENGRNQIIY